ncbi:nitrite reductase/ring-hydroxylating ferredoxin subunit [Kribbella aluminosa]|uniref:Nitrite reductase/ring-hydroxylating ferredoxin subunit n=1 Tax=Kribbella aluminosa TaxID=416017 RepID=A0ABS4UMA0_9ACTN|nr:Rieske (2Fe-2S) protein [Kribbella aluminosa]MBP2352706.1 nitrite reductase/ring-hydroxylating ferredoxin subunit [Kribbella aluminosa]
MSDDTTASATPSAAEGGLRDRRTVLRCAAMVALAGAGAPLLAACGGSDTSGSGPTGGSTSTGGTSTGTSPSATGSSSAPSASASSSGGGGTVLGPVSDVPVGGGKVFTDAKVVVTQPTAGTYKGFSAVCTHQGNPVGSVQGGQIVCPFHNSHFSIKDGSVVSGPAPSPLPAVNVKVQGSNIVTSA